MQYGSFRHLRPKSSDSIVKTFFGNPALTKLPDGVDRGAASVQLRSIQML